ncbi:MAG: DUF4239 domain-containing protein, partial [Syntrophobacterales bacterium]
RFGVKASLRQNNPVTGSIYTIIGGIYGVFLAFTIIIAWSQFLDAKRSVYQEVTHLSELWRDAQVFPEPARQQIQMKLLEYATAVVDSEWDSMALTGKASPVAEKAYSEIWQCYYDLIPQGTQAESFYQTSLIQLNEVGKHRRQRIMESRSKLPGPLWVFLICGGLLTVFFTYLFDVRHLWAQEVVISLLTWLITFGLFLILSLQYPFSGDLSIKPLSFQELVHSFQQRDQ